MTSDGSPWSPATQAVSGTSPPAPAGTWESAQAGHDVRDPDEPQDTRFARGNRFLLHPLTLICAVQTAGCLVLVRSNTAFIDEANYLRLGHLLIAHWLHGKSWPAGYAGRVLSGAPAMYPPIGAVADSAGGLVGARILSLIFMVAATILVYRTASRLLGRTEARIAAALWALSEPVFRLAFATYDPMSVFLIAVAAWLAVEAGYTRRRRIVMVCSAIALGLGVAVAYSGIVIAPVVIAFAFLSWWHRFEMRLARFWTVVMAATAAVVFALIITVCASWPGIAFSIFDRKVNDYQTAPVILESIATYTGLIIILALIGAVVAIRERDLRFRLLLILLGLTALVVPAAQFYVHTSWAFEKHSAYGIWFASIAGAYGCMAMARWLRAAIKRRGVLLAAAMTAIIVVAAANWRLAYSTFRGWPNAASFVSSMKQFTPRSSGLIYASAQKRVAEYYTPEGEQWWLWKVTAMSLDPPGLPRSRWYAYFVKHLRTVDIGMIALFYSGHHGIRLPAGTDVSAGAAARMTARLGQLDPLKLSEPGVPVLTRVLSHNHEFRLVTVGPYDSTKQNGIYAIWLKQPRPG